ncbi:hypothetical protein ColTof3_12360 [Colletotrichum tofieldiae]|nr:hypothetical protein ColTof3_12360 [Colletotrichum tofieldiae]
MCQPNPALGGTLPTACAARPRYATARLWVAHGASTRGIRPARSIVHGMSKSGRGAAAATAAAAVISVP